jgi:hypothetical protein
MEFYAIVRVTLPQRAVKRNKKKKIESGYNKGQKERRGRTRVPGAKKDGTKRSESIEEGL